MAARPRIKDIARAVGVSPATVSRALAGGGLVAEPTLTRIRNAASELGYRPNVRARSLRTQRSMAVLVVVRDVGNPFYLEVFKGVEAVAREAGYSVLMGNTGDDPDRESEYFDMLGDGHADGMILMTGRLPAARRDDPSAPVVLALEMVEGADHPRVLIDNVAAAETATRHLIDLGHRRIAHIAGPLPEWMSTRRAEGWRRALAAAGIEPGEGWLQVGDFRHPSGLAAMRALLALPEPPTAIFAANDEMAYGAIREARRRGLRIPQDLSVVGFDDLYLSATFSPPLTTVSQPRLEIGRQAMALLLDALSGLPPPARRIELPVELVVRDTTAPPASAGSGTVPQDRTSGTPPHGRDPAGLPHGSTMNARPSGRDTTAPSTGAEIRKADT